MVVSDGSGEGSAMGVAKKNEREREKRERGKDNRGRRNGAPHFNAPIFALPMDFPLVMEELKRIVLLLDFTEGKSINIQKIGNSGQHWCHFHKIQISMYFLLAILYFK